MQHHASRAVYGALLEAGIEIIEYEPSFLHAKVAVMDSRPARSRPSARRTSTRSACCWRARPNVFVRDEAFGAELRGHLMDAIAHEGRRVESDVYMKRPLRTRSLAWLAYAMIQFALYATGKRY